MKDRSLQIAYAILLAVALGACHSSGSGSGGDDDDTPVTVTPGPTVAGEVIFTEIMANPDAFADPFGEWFEVRNDSGEDLNLQDCVFSDDASNFLVNGELIIAADEYKTFAHTELGFTPDYVYNAGNIMLSNTADKLTLTCNGVKIDERAYSNPATGSSSALSNDGSGNWCVDLINPYPGGDSGTPGKANININC